MMRRNIAFLVSCALLAACGGGGGTNIPSAPSQSGSGMGSMAFTLKVPGISSQARPRSPKTASPRYLSPAVKGAGMSFATTVAALPAVGSPQLAIDLSTCSPTGVTPCTQNSDGSRTYTVSSPLVPLGTYAVGISTWDAAPVGNAMAGNELSEGAATANVTGTNTAINVTLNGIPTSITMTPVGSQSHIMGSGKKPQFAAPVPTPFHPVGNTPTQWIITALDADGNIIAGSGAPAMSFSDSTNTVSMAPTGSQTNEFTMKVLQAQPASITLTVTATYNTQAASNLTTVGTFNVQPIEELWTTITGVGIGGYPLDPAGSYGPIGIGCCGTIYEQTDGVATTDTLGALAQDSNGNIWVVDTTTNKIQQYSVGTGTVGMVPTSLYIPLTGLNILGLAGDANGFLYGIDGTTNSLWVWSASSGSVAFGPIALTGSPTGSNGVSVIPSGSGVASGIAGTLMIGDSNGIDFYSNAKNGTPTYKGNAPDTVQSGGAYAASVATDTGLLWMMEGSGGTCFITTYTLNSSLAASASALASIGSSDDENAYISAGVNNFAWTSNGTDGNEFYQYQFTPSGPSMGQPKSFPSLSTSHTFGALVVP